MIFGYTLLTEILGNIIRQHEDFQIVFLEQFADYNNVVYNVFDVIFFLYFFYVFWNSLIKEKHKRIVVYGTTSYIIVSFINVFIQDPMLFPQIYAIGVGSITMIISVLLYFKELRLRSSLSVPNKNNLLFWLGIGLLFFYICYPFFMTIGIFHYELYKILHLKHLLYASIVLMYSCFIYGFLKMRRLKAIQP
ncbi:MAG: hypothetical protein V3U92_02955 [Cellulophaga sp.]